MFGIGALGELALGEITTGSGGGGGGGIAPPANGWALGHGALGEDALGGGTGSFTLGAGAGSIILTGYPVTLAYLAYKLDAGAGAITLTGFPVTLDYSVKTLNAGAGAITLTGFPVTMQVITPDTRSLTDGVGMKHTTVTAMTAVLTAGVGIEAVTPIFAYLAGAQVIETIAIQHVQEPSAILAMSITERIALVEQLMAGMPVALTDGVGVEAVLSVITAVTILENLLVAPVLNAGGIYGVTLTQALALSSALQRFLSADLAETVGISPALATLLKLGAVIEETIGVELVDTPTLLISIVLEENIEITPTQLLSMIFSETITEQVDVTAAYISPGGNIVTWVMNTRTNAVTEYENYAFNSFARMGRKYLAASSDGLYELLGDTDDGEDIIAKIQSGFAQFNGSKLAGFKAAYIGMRGEGDFILRLETGDGKLYDYGVHANDMATTKVNMGKGLRARYFSFELISTGSDFELDNIEFVPLMMNRRV